MLRKRKWFAFVTGAAVAWTAAAQVPSAPTVQPRGGPFGPAPAERLLPAEPLRPEPRPDIHLPPPAPPAQPARIWSAPRVPVSRFRIVGNTVFDEAELHGLVAQYEGRVIGNEEIEDARLRLTAHYVKHGYVNSGAVVPDQDIAGGVITLQIIEGRLTDIVITGDNRFDPDYIRARVAAPDDRPLNLGPLQERLQLLLQNPLVERANAGLGPGERPGEAVLRLDVKEAPRYEAGYAFSNSRPPSIGSNQHELWFGARNLLGRGIAVQVHAGHTNGIDDYSLAASVPLNASDTRLLLRADKGRSVVIEVPFNALDIVSRSDSLAVGVAHPFYRSLQREFSLGVHYIERQNETFLLGIPFSFTPGLADGRSTIKAARLNADYVDRTEQQVIAARLTLTYGLDIGGATINPGFPDGNYTTRFAQFQWVRRLSEIGNQLLLRVDAQGANGSLLPSEKIAVGGMYSVRGYRENLLVKDNGWSGSLEYRHPLAASLTVGALELGRLQFAAFTDAGRAVDDHDLSPGRKSLSSVGVGLLWDPLPGVQLNVAYANALKPVQVLHPSPQDRGLHFRLSVQSFF